MSRKVSERGGADVRRKGTGAERPRPCKGCVHFRRLCESHNGNDLSRTYVCNYILDMDEPRGCLVYDCKRKSTDKGVWRSSARQDWLTGLPREA